MPVQELAFALSTAVAYLDRVKEADVLSSDEFENVVGRISFFVNSVFFSASCSTVRFEKSTKGLNIFNFIMVLLQFFMFIH